MTLGNNIIIDCKAFEELLSEHIDKTLEPSVNAAVAEHAMACPLCHALLNDVKGSIEACHAIAAPPASMTRLEARVITMTTPETAMTCDDFEGYLTDYLDGFLPAQVFHRWERHAALCGTCEDLPGIVVRSIATLYTYKTDELAVPDGLHERILRSTLGTAEAEEVKPSWTASALEWLRGIRLPIAVPQLAPVAAVMMFAFLFFNQTVSADGDFTNFYQKSYELAETAYRQSSDALTNGGEEPKPIGEPVEGTRFVDNDSKK